MKIKFRKVSVVIFIFCIISKAYSQNGFGLPGSIYYFNSNARSLGLAKADVTIDNDVNAILWNPAGLARLERKEISSTYVNLLFDAYYFNFLAAFPEISFLQMATVGVGLIWINSGSFVQTDFYNRKLTTNGFGFSEKAVIFSIANQWPVTYKKIRTDTTSIDKDFNLSIGINLKFYNQAFTNLEKYADYIAPYSKWSVNADFGLLIQENVKGVDLTLGANLISAFSSKINSSDRLPMIFRGGLEISYVKRDASHGISLGGKIIYNIDKFARYKRELGQYLGFEPMIDFKLISKFTVFVRIGLNSISKKGAFGLGFEFIIYK